MKITRIETIPVVLDDQREALARPAGPDAKRRCLAVADRVCGGFPGDPGGVIRNE